MEVVRLRIGGKIQGHMSSLALETDQIGTRPPKLNRCVQLLFPHQFVTHETVNAAKVGALIRVLDQAQHARHLLQPRRMVGATGRE